MLIYGKSILYPNPNRKNVPFWKGQICRNLKKKGGCLFKFGEGRTIPKGRVRQRPKGENGGSRYIKYSAPSNTHKV